METVNGCTVIPAQDLGEPTHFGPAETAGAYVAIIGVFPPGQPAPPLHLHPDTDEAFYVAEGDAISLLGDREVPATRGGLVFVPRGTAHTVWNAGDGPVRVSSSSHRATLSIRSFPSTPTNPTASV